MPHPAESLLCRSPDHAAQSALAAQRREQVMALRARGKTFAEIGQELGVSATAAHKAFRRALKLAADRLANRGLELIAAELARLDVPSAQLLLKMAQAEAAGEPCYEAIAAWRELCVARIRAITGQGCNRILKQPPAPPVAAAQSVVNVNVASGQSESSADDKAAARDALLERIRARQRAKASGEPGGSPEIREVVEGSTASAVLDGFS
jgi:hypothetical protein